MELPENFKSKWEQHLARLSNDGKSGPEIAKEIQGLILLCQSTPGEHREDLEMEAPALSDQAGWSRVFTTLRGGQVGDVLFCDTEGARPDTACPQGHRRAPPHEIPCYNNEARKNKRTGILASKLDAFVDWQWATAFWQSHQCDACPGFCRLLTISNASGNSICVDFYELGGVPEAVKEAMNDKSIAKVFFNLRSDWGRLRATICGLEADSITSFYDAEFYEFPAGTRDFFDRATRTSWRACGQSPKLVAVVKFWLQFGRRLPSRKEMEAIEAEGITGSLKNLVKIFGAGSDLNKDQRVGASVFHQSSHWLVDKPKKLDSEDRIYALRDAIVLPLVYIGSLVAVPEWREIRTAPVNMLQWIEMMKRPEEHRNQLLQEAGNAFCREKSLLNAILGVVHRKREAAENPSIRKKAITDWSSEAMARGKVELGPALPELRRLIWDHTCKRLNDRWDLEVFLSRTRARKEQVKRQRQRKRQARRGQASQGPSNQLDDGQQEDEKQEREEKIWKAALDQYAEAEVAKARREQEGHDDDELGDCEEIEFLDD